MLVNRESEQMTFSAKFDALLQSKVAAGAQGGRATSAVDRIASADKQLREQATSFTTSSLKSTPLF
jgi:hypothetical protein